MDDEYTLVGVDGNAFSVMAYVAKCMKNENFSVKEIKEYRSKAMNGDYNNLLCVSMDYVEECNKKHENEI